MVEGGIASIKFLESKILSLCDAERIGLTGNVEYFEIAARNTTRKLGKKEGGRRNNNCAQIVSIITRTKEFRKVHMRKRINKVDDVSGAEVHKPWA